MADLFGPPGTAVLDYGDSDHEFRVTVTAIPRRRLAVPPEAVGTVADVQVRVLDVVIGGRHRLQGRLRLTDDLGDATVLVLRRMEHRRITLDVDLGLCDWQ